ncbi:hypothetical protein HBI41_125740 [Parastagonospora nodorum]|nr:hypothetical protein HBI41_125740 [Parastagonospora nodorum]
MSQITEDFGYFSLRAVDRCEPVGINNMISYILRHEVPPRGQHRRSVLEGDSPLKYFGVQVSEPQSRYVRAAVANWKEKRPTATF